MSIHSHARRYAAVALVAITALIPVSSRAGVNGTVTANGFTFVNFDPASGSPAGSFANGISNKGQLVVTGTDFNGNFTNLTGTPGRTFALNLGLLDMAFGINSGGTVVGTHNGAAFFMPPNVPPQSFLGPANTTNAFGINDLGNVVGQFTSANGNSLGFLVRNKTKSTYITIYPPSGPQIVNAQGINNFGVIVGFYVGNDGQDNGFIAKVANAHNASLTGQAVADPAIPNVPGEPGATFVFSQILAVNDAGIAVGYYGDSTTSQHGFIYDTNTGIYTFLDDPSEAFNNGVEVTQITGISDSGELSGFYSDANGVSHSFTACPTDAFCPNYPKVIP
jgi:probable HAF family extracellular repeat protein